MIKRFLLFLPFLLISSGLGLFFLSCCIPEFSFYFKLASASLSLFLRFSLGLIFLCMSISITKFALPWGMYKGGEG
ncbi:hypothetical protein BDZ91DRAFT_251331 [Kalaharituber pfeilii]|nr:hypothetical protein BDZ91DRAFT_251331 [Kalaharituber pfeilii]